jgi:hypothetical protein
MLVKHARTGVTAVAALIAALAPASAGQTEMEQALAQGADQLTSDEIARTLVGKSVKFVAASNDQEVWVHYGADNVVTGELIGGDWSGTGFYGVADDDQVCLSWQGRDEGRLRCLYLLEIDGTPHKFRADGSRAGALVRLEDGKVF